MKFFFLCINHARDAFTCSPNRVIGELRCVIWALRSLKDLGVQDITIGLDLRDAFTAIANASLWSRYH